MPIPDATQPRLSLGQSRPQAVASIQFIRIDFKFTGFDVNHGKLAIVARFKLRSDFFFRQRFASASEFFFAVSRLNGCREWSPENCSNSDTGQNVIWGLNSEQLTSAQID